MMIKVNCDGYQYGKDVQRLEDQMNVQAAVTERSIHLAGWGMIALSVGGYLILSIVSNLDKRIRKIEDKLKKEEPADAE